MELSRLKNCIIFILLVVNLFLLGLSASRIEEEKIANESLNESVLLYLSQENFAIDEAVLPVENLPQISLGERNQAFEGSLAKSFIDYSAYATSGGTVTYSSVVGKMIFDSDGSFSLSFPEGLWAEKELTEEEYLDKAFGELLPEGYVILREEEDTIWLRPLLAGYPVYSCTVVVSLKNTLITNISGTKLTGDSSVSGENWGYLSQETLLVRLCSALKSLGEVPSEILSIEVGFVHDTETLYAGTQIFPVWYVETDLGGFYLNCQTGELV